MKHNTKLIKSYKILYLIQKKFRKLLFFLLKIKVFQGNIK